MADAISLSTDLPYWILGIAIAVGCVWLGLLVFEIMHHRTRRWWVLATGLWAITWMSLALLRPVRLHETYLQLSPNVSVLLDTSASMQLSGDGASRIRVAALAAKQLEKLQRNARISLFSFGKGAPRSIASLSDLTPANQFHSNLTEALEAVAKDSAQLPNEIVVISDGRLDAPVFDSQQKLSDTTIKSLGIPIHGVWVASKEIADASIRSVKAPSSVVAHQSTVLSITVACNQLKDCSQLPVSVQELMQSGSSRMLAQATAVLRDGEATMELPITLDRSGWRVVKISLDAPKGDTIAENNDRYLTFDVTRDRVRILHIAGRPSYDVRAMRQWLTSDSSLDVVTFFILRSLTDDVNASADDLALIRFPVDELFTEHLSSFDVVVLQDFDALSYGLYPYLSNVAKYVKDGGGLVMVGGMNGFSAGNYASTPLEEVLPVKLVNDPSSGIHTDIFEPRYTAAGAASPVMQELRRLFGERIAKMSGVNTLGDAKQQAVVLWEHPILKTAAAKPMPVLSLGQPENGRVIALAVDGTHHFSFGSFGAQAAGRGYGALWDALLGWLMREPRYDSARIEFVAPCVANTPTPLKLHLVPELPAADVSVQLMPLSSGTNQRIGAHQGGAVLPIPINLQKTSKNNERKKATIRALTLPPLAQGGYSVALTIGKNPTTLVDFACETAGQEWADPRPDPQLLQQIAKQTHGQAVAAADIDKLKFSELAPMTIQKKQAPLLPSWIWALFASIGFAIHWFTRRWAGLP